MNALVAWRVRNGVLRLALICLLLGACSSNYRFDPPKPGTVERGMASWYGEPFHGRATASGEIYDMYGISAAHKQLPLGTRIEVTNLENGRKLTMRVNDRGPFIRGRILDLSYGAAKELDIVQQGLAKVEIRVLDVGKGLPGPELTSRYTIQVGAFRDRDNALELRHDLQKEHSPVEIVTSDGWHRVRVGDFRKSEEAEKLRRKLAARGLSAIVIPLD